MAWGKRMVLGAHSMDHTEDMTVYKTRRNELVRSIKEKFPENEGIILLFAGFEDDRTRFCQDSSFYYLTGIREPGVVLAINLEGKSTLYVPRFAQDNRSKWMGASLSLSDEDALKSGVDEIKELGIIEKGYKICCYPSRDEYKGLLELIAHIYKNQGACFTLCPQQGCSYCWQKLLLSHIDVLMPGFDTLLKDISPIMDQIRRRKDLYEIEQLYKATEITFLAHEAAAQAIMPDVQEREVQASLEYMITGSGAECAFPSIVASGKQGTILHYIQNSSVMKSGELVIVDIGAQYNHYCADITRTYPVSGFFSSRQRELYEIVLKTQEYVASLAKPGYWLNNDEHPDKSLNHLAKEFLKDQGYQEYMVHGIGHFLGLDVHDVGDPKKPLQENDVITIEPGLYLSHEQIGIRIEDDYWIVKDGVICLSEGLPKQPDEIELFVQQRFSDDAESSSAQKDYDFFEDEIDA